MGKKTKFFIVTFVIAALAAGGVYLYIMNAGGRDLTTEQTDFAVTSKDIIGEYKSDMAAADKKYLEKAVVIKGTVTQVEGTIVTIDSTVSCAFKQADASVKVGQMISVKGRVVGYNDLMEELNLDQCFKQ